MGFSRMHSTLVGLVLNRTSGSITPQFHVVYDDYFSTVCSNQSDISQSWSKIFTHPSTRMQIPLDEDDDPELDDEWYSKEEASRCENLRKTRVESRLGRGANETEPLEPPDDALSPNYDYQNDGKDRQTSGV